MIWQILRITSCSRTIHQIHGMLILRDQNLHLPFKRDPMYSDPMFTIQERPNVLRTYVYHSRETQCIQNLRLLFKRDPMYSEPTSTFTDPMYSEPMFTIQQRPNVLRTYVYDSRETQCTQNLCLPFKRDQMYSEPSLPFKRYPMYSEPMFTIQE